MPLKAKKPEAMKKRLKLMLFGKAGIGKTTAAIQMPKPYIIDTERGTEHSGYVKLITEAGGAVLQTANADDVIAELKALLSEKHNYKTLVIDPITNIEDNVIQAASLKYDADAKEGGDMRVWRDRDRTNRRIVSLILQLDMNVVMTMHGKIEYGENFTKLGTSFEGWKKWDYLFDLALEIRKVGEGEKAKRIAHVRKTRIEAFPDGADFEWSYQELAKRYGADVLEREVVPVAMASKEQVAELNRLVQTVKLPDGAVEKWKSKAGVEEFADMPADTIAKCIDFVKAKLDKATGE